MTYLKFQPGTVYVLWAYHSTSDDFTQYHSSRGHSPIVLLYALPTTSVSV